uniref:Mg-protoporphyrin IX chelatase n=1 Tax=Chromera velia CCMP2878 TaxID=1169474 RepID=A0A0G4F5Q6_9ALVE|eukprot:Cvel_15147.t1-p1 / transcript=Cvel_15147.t1 / gene=Cvel_15147 / organism=Chromera_velia_CCMP2878 / gene_product=Magnesium-chelatase subunit ChlD, putative / transcript_product=Magnesium-chelatase subunit ChlD, putative / location=Cvel_scaffold1106:1432-8331(-) / protein_length=776 / sequence_SO=supercontig / SO=protein_coding / is_pseudo=false
MLNPYTFIVALVAVLSAVTTVHGFRSAGWGLTRNQHASRSAKTALNSAAVVETAPAAVEVDNTLDSMEQGPTAPPPEKSSDFPLSMIVGNDPIKLALLLGAVNRDMGGVIVSGRRGTGKSVMARALHRLMPPIEIVKGSQYNVDPSKPEEIDDFLADELKESGKQLEDLPTEIVQAPFVQVPLNAMEDRLVGSVDVEESVKQGKTVFQPGLLAKAHRGILYIDDLNLLDSELANILLTVVSDGEVVVERDGLSVRYPCKPLIIATFNPEEGELRNHLLDRLAVSLSCDAAPLSLDERVEAVTSVGAFSDRSRKPKEERLVEALEEEDDLRTQIIFAREYLKRITCTPDQLQYLCNEAARAGCQGHRAELFACEVARASAALEGKDQVEADDLKLAVKLVIAPRGTFFQMDEPEMQQPPPPPPPPKRDEENTDEDNEDEDQEQEEEDQEQEKQEEQPQIPQEFMFDAEGTPVDDELLDFAHKQKKGKSGGRGLIFSEDRGRYIKPMFPKGKVKRLSVDATMRAAAPYQRSRRVRFADNPRKRLTATGKERKVFIEQSDVRVKRMARKAGSLIIFVVDASGSMALNRMNAAKGAAISLLSKAYESRDKIALISFQGSDATVLLPPTRSIAMAKRRLETMPCGGGSPLAHALNVAVQTGLSAQKSGDTGKVVMVCISDGRANVPISDSLERGGAQAKSPEERPSKEELKKEVIDTAKALRALPTFHLVMLDMENQFVSTGFAKEVADVAGGTYYRVPKATESKISAVASEAVAGAKGLF